MTVCLLFVFLLGLATAKREWTILHYNEADDRVLESSLIDNIHEMVRAMTKTSDYTFNLVVRYDGWKGQKELDPSLGKITEVIDLLVNYNDGLKVLQRLGELDMQDSNNMINFFVKYINMYPANNYMLVFADHGDAFRGYGGDDHLPGTTKTSGTIYASTLEQRLKTVLNKTKVPSNKFSIIGFDACLMGNLESLDIFSSVADYVIASQWTEPARGWDYRSLSSITNKTTPRALAETIIRDYTAANIEIEQAPSTLAVYDMSQVSNVVNALSAFVTSTGAISPAILEDASKARAIIPCDDALCDFGSFVNNFLEFVSDDPEFNEVVYNGYLLKEAIEQFIVFFMSGPEDDGTSGLAIWFPETQYQQQTNYRTVFPRFYLWWGWLGYFINTLIVPVERAPRIGDMTATYDQLRNEVRFTATVSNPGSILNAYLWISYVDPGANTYALMRLPANVISRALDGAGQEEAGPGDRAGVGQFYNYTGSRAVGNSTGSRSAGGNSTSGSRSAGGNVTSGSRSAGGMNGTRATGNFSRAYGPGANRTALGPSQGFLEAFWDVSYYTWPGNVIQNWPWADIQYETSNDEFRKIEFRMESHKINPLQIDNCSVITNWNVGDGAWSLDSSQMYCKDSVNGGEAEVSLQTPSLKDEIVGDLYPIIIRNRVDATGATPLTWPLYVQRQPWNPSAYNLQYHFSITDLGRSTNNLGYNSNDQTLPPLSTLVSNSQPVPPPTVPVPVTPPVSPPSTPPTPPGPSTTPEVDNGDEWLSRGAFAGIIVGCVVGTFLLTAVIFLFVCKPATPDGSDHYYSL